jgi:hypothetical protein
VLAIDEDGNLLPPNPELVRGETIALLVGGFGAGADVDVTLNSTPRDLGTITADGDGIVEFEFSVPGDLEAGPHSLVFVGPAFDDSAVQRQVVVDGVNTVTYAFTVAEDASAEESPAGNDAGAGSGGSLPETGGSPFGPAATGMLLLLAGLALVVGSARLYPRTDRLH